QDLHESQETVKVPLNSLREKELCPGSEMLKKINEEFR
ncbi:MAG: 2-oxoglutarate ferredoxin oxidoreductase subunit beta, partial [Saprospiraceae bacterium]